MLMLKTSGFFAAALFAASLGGAASAFAQSPPAPGDVGQPPAQQSMPGMQHGTPMQGGGMMCGPGGSCGMGHPAQGAPMHGMTQQGQGGMMQGGCPMMQRAASLERRLRQLEERMGITAPPQPAQPGSPG